MTGMDLTGIIVNAGGVGAGLLGIAMVAMRAWAAGVGRIRHIWSLLAILTLLTVDCAFSIYGLSPAIVRFPSLIGAEYVLLAWLPTALWIYADSLTSVERRDRSLIHWHVAISSTAMACLLPMLILPGDDRRQIVEGSFEVTTASQALMLLGVLAFLIIWIAHLVATGVGITRRLWQHRQRVRTLYADVTKVDLRWFDRFLVFMTAGITLCAADTLLPLMTGTELLNGSMGALFEASVVFGLALFGLNQDRAVPDWAEEVEEPEPAVPAVEKAEVRYARSSLSEADCADIIGRLDRAMRTDHVWRDPFLNLKALAESISTRPYYVTQALNTALGRNFYDYVNGWRVRAACAALAGGNDSVLSISEAVGFNSKSTFNTVFRKEMGVTPSAYRRSGGGVQAPEPA